MTEAEWLGCTDPATMLEFLTGKVSERKMRLFAVGCCRSIWLALPISTKGALQVVERFIEKQADRYEFQVQAVTQATQSSNEQERSLLLGLTYFQGTIYHPDHVSALKGMVAATKMTKHVSILRDIFGYPFRHVSIDPALLTPTVTGLAQAAYEERNLPTGELDPERLAVLSDALEEAGCRAADILDHLRGPGPHVRGCWCLDLLLGKE